MLVAMEIALGVVLGLLGVVLAGLAALLVLRRRDRSRPDLPPAPPTAPEPGFGDDDLPGFLDSPPGAGSAPGPSRAGWASLTAAPPPPPPPPSDGPRRGRDAPGVLGAMAAAAVLLAGVAVAVAATVADPRPHRGTAEHTSSASPGAPAAPSPGAAGAGALADESVPLGPDGAAARLTFRGVVLERHAVGVTATYPGLRLTSDGERSLVHLELPTFHCLTDEAPADPVAAGCSRSVPEYADLGSPDLRLTGSGDRLRLAGAFPTYLRPNGGPPEWTGRVYRIEVTVDAGRGRAAEGWRPAEGRLELGSDRTGTTADPGVNVLRSGS
jgi:hypothetical protein